MAELQNTNVNKIQAYNSSDLILSAGNPNRKYGSYNILIDVYTEGVSYDDYNSQFTFCCGNINNGIPTSSQFYCNKSLGESYLGHATNTTSKPWDYCLCKVVTPGKGTSSSKALDLILQSGQIETLNDNTTTYTSLKLQAWSKRVTTSTNIYTDEITFDSSYAPGLQPSLFPSSTTASITLGNPSKKWSTIYSTSSTIQTSDRSAKEDIHYLDEKQPKIKTLSASTSFSTTDIINFIEKLNPCTFVYKDTKDEPIYTDVQSALNSNNTEMVQLGLIDDIKDEPLFNYIGATMKYQDEI